MNHLTKLLMVATFVAMSSSVIAQTGKASYYGDKFHGRLTANGERFNQNALTAANKKLKFGTKVRVTNLANGKKIVVRINDRGKFGQGVVIDLSKGAFKKISGLKVGIIKIKLEVVK